MLCLNRAVAAVVLAEYKFLIVHILKQGVFKMSLYRIIKRTSWFILAAAAICVGLEPFGINMEAVLHIQTMDMTLRYIVGICGLVSCIDFVSSYFMSTSSKCCTK